MSWFTIIKDEPLQRSFELLQSILKENAGNITILTEPYIDAGEIIGVVEVTGTSGNTYTIDFQNSCPTIHREITIYPEEILSYISDYVEVDELTFDKDIEICLTAGAIGREDVPTGDSIVSMVLGLIDDDKSSDEIESLHNSIYSDPVDYEDLAYNIGHAIEIEMNNYAARFEGRFEQ
jgi:hypothetical protein